MQHNSFFVSIAAICGSIIIAGGLIAAAVIYSSGDQNTENTAKNLQQQREQQQKKDVSFELSDSDARIGDKDAPVTIVEFSDYGCPFCQRFHQKTYPKIKEEYIDTGKVQYIFKHRPLTRLHPKAEEQAIFMQCVAKNAGDDSFFDLTKKVFANQKAAKEQAKMYDLASQVGVKKEEIASCVTDKNTQGKVDNDNNIGAEIGVQGTPSFAIGTVKNGTLKGKLLVGAQPYSRFESLVNPILN